MQKDETSLPKVVVVLVNYNGWQDTIECLESLLRSNASNVKIVIVDNASQNDSLLKIESWARGELNPWSRPSNPLRAYFFPPCQKPYPYEKFQYQNGQFTFVEEHSPSSDKLNPLNPIVLIDAGTNLGFAGGNNLGICFASVSDHPDYFWLLNNDTVVPPGSLSQKIFFAEKRKAEGRKVGIIGSKLFYYHEPHLLQAVGGKYQKWFALSKHIGVFETDHGQYDQKLELDYIIGASMFVPKAFIDDVGLMAENYFLYYEELDWAERGKRKGWALELCPSSIVYHKEGASIGGTALKKKKSALSAYYGMKNRLVFTKRFYPEMLGSVLFFLPFVLLGKARRLGLKNSFRLFKELIKGWQKLRQ
jgi:GT2 family glycosyltransferase